MILIEWHCSFENLVIFTTGCRSSGPLYITNRSGLWPSVRGLFMESLSCQSRARLRRHNNFCITTKTSSWQPKLALPCLQGQETRLKAFSAFSVTVSQLPCLFITVLLSQKVWSKSHCVTCNRNKTESLFKAWLRVLNGQISTKKSHSKFFSNCIFRTKNTLF